MDAFFVGGTSDARSLVLWRFRAKTRAPHTLPTPVSLCVISSPARPAWSATTSCDNSWSGARPSACWRRWADDRSLAGLPVETALGDITVPETLPAALAECDVVIHAAAQVHIGWTGAERSATRERRRHDERRPRRRRRARMIYVSSVNALGLGNRAQPANEETPHADDGHVPCPYVLSKRAAEKIVLDEVAAGLDAVIVNPGYMLGPWDWKPSSGKLLLQLAGGWAKLAPRGGNDFCDVRDVATGILAAVEKGKAGRRYILGGEPLSFLEAFTLIASVVGVKPPWRCWRKPMLVVCKRWGDAVTFLTGREPEMNGAAIEISELQHHFDCGRRKPNWGTHSARPAQRWKPPGPGSANMGIRRNRFQGTGFRVQVIQSCPET
ncbi:MAG: NAD-dependent epimerase/dehydratase family protein [Pirellulales bacterium]